MVTQISIQEMAQEIEAQKRAALIGTSHIWCEMSNSAHISALAQKINGICENPDLFVTHSFKSSINPAATAKEIAACLPRILIFACFRKTDQETMKYIHQVFPKGIEQLPFATLRVVEVSSPSEEEVSFLQSLPITGNPTILTFKLGHLIDSFVPEIGLPLNITDQLADRANKIKEDMKTYVPVSDYKAYQLGADAGKEDFEERLHKQQIEEAEKKHIEEIAEKKRIKDRLAQMHKEGY